MRLPAMHEADELACPQGERLEALLALLGIALEGASAVRNGSAQQWLAQGMGTSNCRQIQRKPLTLTKWEWLERTGSR